MTAFGGVLLLLLATTFVVDCSLGRFGDSYHEDWGYTVVRPGAHMFWWLYSKSGDNRPLIIWLQVGLRVASVGGVFSAPVPVHRAVRAPRVLDSATSPR